VRLLFVKESSVLVRGVEPNLLLQIGGNQPIGGRHERLDLEAIRKPLFAASKKYLADIESHLGSEGIKVKTESLEGNRPADIITEYAQKEGVDLIIIGTHGYTGLKKLMLGSVASGVLHQSHIPVLLIRPESCRA
jgi:nucleotide-binding universal stress UspA family protein